MTEGLGVDLILAALLVFLWTELKLKISWVIVIGLFLFLF